MRGLVLLVRRHGEDFIAVAVIAIVVALMLAALQPGRPVVDHCGCPAKDCEMPCSSCCAPDPCPCNQPDPTGAR